MCYFTKEGYRRHTDTVVVLTTHGACIMLVVGKIFIVNNVQVLYYTSCVSVLCLLVNSAKILLWLSLGIKIKKKKTYEYRSPVQ